MSPGVKDSKALAELLSLGVAGKSLKSMFEWHDGLSVERPLGDGYILDGYYLVPHQWSLETRRDMDNLGFGQNPFPIMFDGSENFIF